MFKKSAVAAAVLSVSAFGMSNSAIAQETSADTEVIEVSGIRSSLTAALAEKRDSDSIVDIIQATDIGKLPDQNLAEVLEALPGIQITRTAGVGTAVQIRGTDENRVEINGVSTVGSGSGRGGISFEDLPAALISSVEVTKAPSAEMIEGSVGGTINLRTLRPLELNDRVISFRGQVQNSDLDVDDEFTPRISGTFGDNWDVDQGVFGAVISASYATQNVSAFRPRLDRDGLVESDQNYAAASRNGEDADRLIGSAEEFDFLRVQFLLQDYQKLSFETLNLSSSFEWAPNDNLRLFTDLIHNDQERTQETTTIQFSGVSDVDVVDLTTNTSFETINLGVLNTSNGPITVPAIQATTSGILLPDTANASGLNPNLRTTSNSGARLTKSTVFRIGGEFTRDNYEVFTEFSMSTSDTTFPGFATRLDFINPNSAQPTEGNSIDNGVPVIFDLTRGPLQFGIAQGLASTPSTQQLLDPANYALSQAQAANNKTENEEIAFRTDFKYYLDDIDFITSVTAGYRYNDTSTLNDEFISNRINLTSASSEFNRPFGDSFANLLTAGPNNFDSADGRELFVEDFLVIDPQLTFNNLGLVTSTLNTALVSSYGSAENVRDGLISDPTRDGPAFFDVSEQTHALYTQVNFETEMFRGNFGLRYIQTEQESIGFFIDENGDLAERVESSDYNFLLPRLNIVGDLHDDVVARFSVGRDINRPDFDDLSTSVVFGTNANAPVSRGNPNLVPEDIWSVDLSVEYYFAPSSVVSAGIFFKEREDLFFDAQSDPESNVIDGVLNIEIDPACTQGGIFNPFADRNINNPIPGDGICVPLASTFNGNGSTRQKGIELAFQYDLSQFEDELGWASGFGIITNYTYQDASGVDDFRQLNGRGRTILNALGIDDDSAVDRVELQNLSNNSYNFTVFYENYGISARARYTWRSAFISTDFPQWGLPRVNEARGQLNASINYDINDQLSVGLDAINLTQSDADQSCVNEGAIRCFQGLTDRRILLGVNYQY